MHTKLVKSATLKAIPFSQKKDAILASTAVGPDFPGDSTDCFVGDVRRSSITCCFRYFPAMDCSWTPWQMTSVIDFSVLIAKLLSCCHLFCWLQHMTDSASPTQPTLTMTLAVMQGTTPPHTFLHWSCTVCEGLNSCAPARGGIPEGRTAVADE